MTAARPHVIRLDRDNSEGQGRRIAPWRRFLKRSCRPRLSTHGDVQVGVESPDWGAVLDFAKVAQWALDSFADFFQLLDVGTRPTQQQAPTPSHVLHCVWAPTEPAPCERTKVCWSLLCAPSWRMQTPGERRDWGLREPLPAAVTAKLSFASQEPLCKLTTSSFSGECGSPALMPSILNDLFTVVMQVANQQQAVYQCWHLLLLPQRIPSRFCAVCPLAPRPRQEKQQN